MESIIIRTTYDAKCLYSPLLREQLGGTTGAGLQREGRKRGRNERVRELCDHFLPPCWRTRGRSPQKLDIIFVIASPPRHAATCCSISLPTSLPFQSRNSPLMRKFSGPERARSLSQFANAIPGRRRQRAESVGHRAHLGKIPEGTWRQETPSSGQGLLHPPAEMHNYKNRPPRRKFPAAFPAMHWLQPLLFLFYLFYSLSAHQ